MAEQTAGLLGKNEILDAVGDLEGALAAELSHESTIRRISAALELVPIVIPASDHLARLAGRSVGWLSGRWVGGVAGRWAGG